MHAWPFTIDFDQFVKLVPPSVTLHLLPILVFTFFGNMFFCSLLTSLLFF
jgi:hypothetical protein